jgi:DNA-binding CsgD family transcriptional regulator
MRLARGPRLTARGRRSPARPYGRASISPTTAARHVANILAKLGFRSRAQTAAWVADRPPQGGQER